MTALAQDHEDRPTLDEAIAALEFALGAIVTAGSRFPIGSPGREVLQEAARPIRDFLYA